MLHKNRSRSKSKIYISDWKTLSQANQNTHPFHRVKVKPAAIPATTPHMPSLIFAVPPVNVGIFGPVPVELVVFVVVMLLTKK